MEKHVRKALKGSIRKWKRIVKGVETDAGGENCPLCIEIGCSDCPVAIHANNTHCRGTPYEAWVHGSYRLSTNTQGGYDFNKNTKALRLAQAELDFLKSLLLNKR